ncbi:hypothetical protein KCU64_g4, partial [Aureobasidium melanogenum]
LIRVIIKTLALFARPIKLTDMEIVDEKHIKSSGTTKNLRHSCFDNPISLKSFSNCGAQRTRAISPRALHAPKFRQRSADPTCRLCPQLSSGFSSYRHGDLLRLVALLVTERRTGSDVKDDADRQGQGKIPVVEAGVDEAGAEAEEVGDEHFLTWTLVVERKLSWFSVGSVMCDCCQACTKQEAQSLFCQSWMSQPSELSCLPPYGPRPAVRLTRQK